MTDLAAVVALSRVAVLGTGLGRLFAVPRDVSGLVAVVAVVGPLRTIAAATTITTRAGTTSALSDNKPIVIFELLTMQTINSILGIMIVVIIDKSIAFFHCDVVKLAVTLEETSEIALFVVGRELGDEKFGDAVSAHWK